MFICTHKLGMNVTQESKTHLLSKLLTARGNGRQNKKLLVHYLTASDTRIRVAAVYLVRRDFFFGCLAWSSSICFFIMYDSSFSLSRWCSSYTFSCIRSAMMALFSSSNFVDIFMKSSAVLNRFFSWSKEKMSDWWQDAPSWTLGWSSPQWSMFHN